MEDAACKGSITCQCNRRSGARLTFGVRYQAWGRDRLYAKRLVGIVMIENLHEGGCLCRAARYRAHGEPARTLACHCTFCQRFTGAAYNVECLFPKDQLEFLGTPLVTYRAPFGWERSHDLAALLPSLWNDGVADIRPLSGCAGRDARYVRRSELGDDQRASLYPICSSGCRSALRRGLLRTTSNSIGWHTQFAEALRSADNDKGCFRRGAMTTSKLTQGVLTRFAGRLNFGVRSAFRRA